MHEHIRNDVHSSVEGIFTLSHNFQTVLAQSFCMGASGVTSPNSEGPNYFSLLMSHKKSQYAYIVQ